MKTILPANDSLASEDARRIAGSVASGGTVVFPTDTFYALGADPRSRRGVAGVFSLKGRSRTEPLLLLLDSPERTEIFASAVTQWHRLLMDGFWPGPLTLLFPAREGLPEGIVSPSGEVALRVPGNALSRAVLSAAGGALTGTSANRSGEAPPRSAREALASLEGKPDLAVDGGTLPPSAVSTILGFEGGRPVLVRKGAVPLEAVRRRLARKGVAEGPAEGVSG